MRLAFCNATKAWGGVKTWTLEFAGALRARGHDIVIYGREGKFIERARSMGLPAEAVNFGPDYNPFAIRFFTRSFRSRRVQAVLVNVGRDLRTAGVAARLLGLPLVQRIGLPGDLRNAFSVRFGNRILRPHYLFPCFFNRDGFLANLPFVDAARCTVIHSAKVPAAAAPERVSRPLRLVSTSQLNADKGHAELMRVLAKLRGEGVDFTWDVAGTGRCSEELARLAEELRLADRITWHGFIQDVPAILDSCDVFVLPSYSEGLPNTLLEAMARGLVPVARGVGGIAEVWPESLAALLASPFPRDGSRLEPILRAVFSASDAELLAWKKAAREACVTNFSLDTQSEKLDAYFRELISPGKTPAL